MTTDRELLEKAAKAAGIEWLSSDTDKGKECELKFGLWLRIEGEPNEFTPRRFNPLNDDGDALRLAVKLGICFGPNFDGDKAVADGGEFSQFHAVEMFGADRYAATRRAIVIAAAAIGETHGR